MDSIPILFQEGEQVRFRGLDRQLTVIEAYRAIDRDGDRYWRIHARSGSITVEGPADQFERWHLPAPHFDETPHDPDCARRVIDCAECTCSKADFEYDADWIGAYAPAYERGT